MKNGKGVYKYVTGDIYEGSYENDIKCGYGVIEFLNGDKYTGEWKNDLFHGKGKYIFHKKVEICGNFMFGKL